MDGKKESQKILKSLKRQISKLPTKPGLAVVLVGNDPASQVYVNIKQKRAQELGVYSEKYELSDSISQTKIIELINKLNKSKKIHGILVQLPLPKKFNTQEIIQAINKNKDVDGLKPESKIVPPTVQSIVHLINMSGKKLANKKSVVLCNSPEFAEEIKDELNKNKVKTDILLKKYSRFKIQDLRKFDIIIIALGKKHWLKSDMIKKNAIIIDVGINRVGKKLFGDVHPDCLTKTKYISPVPGGVGPLTVSFLFKNLLKILKESEKNL